MTELVGFSASALVVISMSSSSIYRLRLVGLLGAITFITYGVLSQAWPIVATNAATLTLNVLHLRRFRAQSVHDRDKGSVAARLGSVAVEM